MDGHAPQSIWQFAPPIIGISSSRRGMSAFQADPKVGLTNSLLVAPSADRRVPRPVPAQSSSMGCRCG